MRMRFGIITFAIIICVASPVRLSESSAARKTFYITVAAGQLDRRETVASFPLPKDLKGMYYVLRDESGRAIPLQVDGKGQAVFVLPELKAGATKKYRLEDMKSGASTAAQGVELVRANNRVAIKVAGRDVIGYQAQGELPRADIKPIFRRGGYIHPVYAPSGRVITDDYPPKHLHHHGV